MTTPPKLITYAGALPDAQTTTLGAIDLPATDGALTYTQDQPDPTGPVIVTASVTELNEPPRTVARLDYTTADLPDTITLQQLQVQPDYQTNGHGKRTVRHVLNAAAAHGYKHCDAVTIDEASVAWTVPVDRGALIVGDGRLTFDLNTGDAFYRWLITDATPADALADR